MLVTAKDELEAVEKVDGMHHRGELDMNSFYHSSCQIDICEADPGVYPVTTLSKMDAPGFDFDDDDDSECEDDEVYSDDDEDFCFCGICINPCESCEGKASCSDGKK